MHYAHTVVNHFPIMTALYCQYRVVKNLMGYYDIYYINPNLYCNKERIEISDLNHDGDSDAIDQRKTASTSIAEHPVPPSRIPSQSQFDMRCLMLSRVKMKYFPRGGGTVGSSMNELVWHVTRTSTPQHHRMLACVSSVYGIYLFIENKKKNKHIQ